MCTFRRLPAEWEEQDGVLLAWPHAKTDWADSLDEVIGVYCELVRAISRFERVVIIGPNPGGIRASLSKMNIDLTKVMIIKAMTNDTWCRDFGPITVISINYAEHLDFGFNGWGLKFLANHDNQINTVLIESGILAGRHTRPGLILEGGSIESDGQGTLLTTTTCLLEPNRNPHLSRAEIESRLKQLFNLQHLLWLEHGYLSGDDTDSHIDTLARLAPNNTILYVNCNDTQDEHFSELQSMKQQLQSFRTIDHEPFRLLPLPWPAPIYDNNGKRLPATYANFLVINQAILVPTYNDPADSNALQVVASAFPQREVVPIDCRYLIEQHGSLHCVTMQLPKGSLK